MGTVRPVGEGGGHGVGASLRSHLRVLRKAWRKQAVMGEQRRALLPVNDCLKRGNACRGETGSSIFLDLH